MEVRVPMDHQEALRRGAVEKYLLHEMPDPERDEFEAHFFDCQECAADLRATAAFLDGVKATLLDGAKQELLRSRAIRRAPKLLQKSWFEFLWRPAFAAPALALSLLVIVYQNAVVLPSFACVLIAPSGAVVWRLPVSPTQAKDTVAIRVPAGLLGPGDYRLVVQGR